jgi:cobaltochelatase CobN
MTHICCLVWSSYAGLIAAGLAMRPNVSSKLFSTKALEKTEVALEAKEAMKKASVIFLFKSSDSLWDQFDDTLRSLDPKIPVISVGHDAKAFAATTAGFENARKAHRYLLCGGPDNAALLADFLTALAAGEDPGKVPGPLPRPFEGLWHPKAPSDFFPDVESYLDWYGEYSEDKDFSDKTAGVLMSRHFWVNCVPDVEGALILALEARKLRVIPAFSNALRDKSQGAMGSVDWGRLVFLDDRRESRIDALVKLVNFFGPGTRDEDDNGYGDSDTPASQSVKLFTDMGVPVFQPVFSSGKTIEEWESDPKGLGSEIAWSVAMPEFEGVIEPFYLGGKTSSDTNDFIGIERREPHLRRMERLAARVDGWCSLRKKPVSERKVSFILHNNPCASAEASVGGAAKLDSIESLARILKAMKEAGYRIDPPENGKALIDQILEKKALSEFRWTTIEDIVSSGGALSLLSEEDYKKWFDQYPPKVRERINEAWGDPPGREQNGIPAAMVYKDKIVIPGLDFGNASVSVQPKRGCAGPRCDGRVCKILHDPDVPPPHQYLAVYRWLQDEWGADLLIHVGTHGNLEFLPGKSVGLSGSCLPDLALHEIPHVYIYNSDNPAEGVIAKRRSYATLCDHLQTVLKTGAAGDEFIELDSYLSEWEKARERSPARAFELETLISESLGKANLSYLLEEEGLDAAGFDGEEVDFEEFDVDDLEEKEDKKGNGNGKGNGKERNQAEKKRDFGALARRLHETISLVQGTSILDGLHIFGSLPEDERLCDFVYSILRFDAGEGSIRKAVSDGLGLDLYSLLESPEGFDEERGESASSLILKIDSLSKKIISEALKPRIGEPVIILIQNILKELRDEIIDPGALSRNLEKPLKRLMGIRSRLSRTKEIPSLLSAMEGKYLPPGPSGIITRGQEDILPTGRNFFTLDPRRLPTPAAALVGKKLAKAIAEKHLKEEGRYPENVAMFWMCNDLMWADGEGLGQILSFLGVRPLWTPDGRVVGTFVIPLSELGRPRIDVTIRVSGLLRDSFPGAMDLVDEAVRSVALLDESPDDNYVKKHTLERLKSLPQDSPDSIRKATYRIFSAMPGVYQAGVNLAVAASAWKTEKDLSDIFMQWNSYAYGKGSYGVESPRALEACLSTADVTYNKVVTDEHDLLGCCGYYGTHGGLTGAAKTYSKNKVKTYYGDTRDSSRPSVRTLKDEIRRVVRAKLLNQNWIDGMKRHGYKGAGDISKRAGRVYGWEAATGEVDDWIFDEMTKTFILDEDNRRFFLENNPWALEEIARRLIEAEARKLWNPDPELLEKLKENYLQIEGSIEERMGENTGEYQGGKIDIVTADEVESWKESLARMREKDA